MTKSVYEKIKKQNGESFARAIRAFDEGIFELPNIAQRLKYAGRDATPLLPVLASFRQRLICLENAKDPFDLLQQAGYKAFYVNSLKKQKSIAHLFRLDERLCTFNDETRYQRNHIIYCIKKGAEKLNRSDFKNPQRQDEYGTSVISIQISKNGGFIKITNRYNHTVPYPDNTFNSNPDNIIDGLTAALKNHFGVEFMAHNRLPKGFIFRNNSIVKYNFEKNGRYFGHDFYIENAINEIDKDKEMLVDCFLFDLKEKRITDLSQMHPNSFVAVLTEELKNKTLQVKRIDKQRRALFADGVKILETKEGALTFLYLPTTKQLPGGMFNDELLSYSENVAFLMYNETLEHFFAPNLITINSHVMENNHAIKSLYLPKVQLIGDNFLMHNHRLKYLNIPMIKSIGRWALRECEIKTFIAPFLKIVEKDVFIRARELQCFSAPELKRVSSGVLAANTRLTRCYTPKLKVSKPYFQPALYSMDEDIKYLQSHPCRKKIISNQANLKRMLKKERFWERWMLWVKE